MKKTSFSIVAMLLFLLLSSPVWSQELTSTTPEQTTKEGPAETTAPPTPSVSATTPEPEFTATNVDGKVVLICQGKGTDESPFKNCAIPEGFTLEDAVSTIVGSYASYIRSISTCGEWGPWITNREGAVIARWRNPACVREGERRRQ